MMLKTTNRHKSLRKTIKQKELVINQGSSKKKKKTAYTFPHMAQTERQTQKHQHFDVAGLQTIQKTDYNPSSCIKDSVCTEWTGYNATRKESGKELWPNKNILNSTTPGSIWFFFYSCAHSIPSSKTSSQHQRSLTSG